MKLKPDMLDVFVRGCDDLESIGRVLKALVGGKVELTPAERPSFMMIKADMAGFAERVEQKRERDARRQAEYRARRAAKEAEESASRLVTSCHTLSHVTECDKDATERDKDATERDVTPCHESPTHSTHSTHPPTHSTHPPTLPTHPKVCANAHTRTRVERDMLIMTAHDIGAPESFADKFAEEMEKQGWAFTAKDGKNVPVTLDNFRTVFAGWWKFEQMEQRKEARHDHDRAANRHGVHIESDRALPF